MPYLSGVLTGVLLTVLVVFLIDHVDDAPGSRDLVNWDVVSSQFGASVEKAGEELRLVVHEATEPGPNASTTPAKPETTQ